jgi:hypothetical protein
MQMLCLVRISPRYQFNASASSAIPAKAAVHFHPVFITRQIIDLTM